MVDDKFVATKNEKLRKKYRTSSNRRLHTHTTESAILPLIIIVKRLMWPISGVSPSLLVRRGSKPHTFLAMRDFQFDDEAPQVRLCEHSECDEIGEFRAPKSRSDIRCYLWFCLAHVREYNRAWNYFQGMSQDEIEAYQHSSNTWHRPTWVMGVNGTADPVSASF